ncbi:hypothetical protein PHYC_00486 [Phycisphaerales bacterium]|nr:hypothetical protein PHYC_00486 [Phycisphaerales bacterium]
MAGTKAAQILEVIVASGAAGLTDDEGEAATGICSSTYTPRRGELENDKLIFDSGAKRRTRAGREAIVWLASPRAREAQP